MTSQRELELKIAQLEAKVKNTKKANLYDKLAKAVNAKAKKQRIREIKIRPANTTSYFSGGVLR